ncbi:MAG: 2-phospho-L-lactate guanylyltransferase [Actinobacteria bacterium]|nr:MAG: 2-phospho-L-lactate guanylyltransferase [Actinomycetota bacterium]
MVDSPSSLAQSATSIAVVIPIKAFGQAKDRLSGVLTADQRNRLARATARGVLESVRGAPVFVVCNDHDVSDWAQTHGATVLFQSGTGLNAAVQEGMSAAHEYERVMIVHSDLPLPNKLRELLGSTVARNTVTIVPDRHRDGTNVLIIPLGVDFHCHYGAQSFSAHVAEANKLGLSLQIIEDDELGLDIDTPDDLLVLPTAWLEQHNITLI